MSRLSANEREEALIRQATITGDLVPIVKEHDDTGPAHVILESSSSNHFISVLSVSIDSWHDDPNVLLNIPYFMPTLTIDKTGGT